MKSLDQRLKEAKEASVKAYNEGKTRLYKSILKEIERLEKLKEKTHA